MIEFSHTITDAQGLHARPVAQICAAARQWESGVTVCCGGLSTSVRTSWG